MGTEWEEMFSTQNNNIYFVVYEEEYNKERDEYTVTGLVSIERYSKKAILSATVVDGRPEFVFSSDRVTTEEPPVVANENVKPALPGESDVASELSVGETVFFRDMAYEYLGITKNERLKMRTIPLAGMGYIEQDLSRQSLDIYRFGLLTGLEKWQEIAYLDDYLKVPMARFDARTAVALGNGRKKLVVSHLWDKDERVKEVRLPSKQILAALPWRKGTVSEVLSENGDVSVVLIRMEDEDGIAEYYFSVDTRHNIRRRNLDFVGEDVYVRVVKASCGPGKDVDVVRYVLEMHFANETMLVDTMLRGKPQGEPDKIYVGRVGVVKYQMDMAYADYWEEQAGNEIEVCLVPHVSERGDTEQLWAVPMCLPISE